jgi:hypothetical protein
MNTSEIEILSGHDNAEQRNISALQLRERNALNFGLVLFKDRDELFVARISFANALFVRKGNIRNAALLRFAAVFHNEMDTIADNDSHRIDPRISRSLTDGGLPCPAQASAAQWLKPSSMVAGISSAPTPATRTSDHGMAERKAACRARVECTENFIRVDDVTESPKLAE